MAEDNDATPSSDSQSTKDERRRPGRVNYPNPYLVRLLRDEFHTRPRQDELFKDDESDEERDDLRTFQGIMIALWISLIIWCVIIALFM